MTADTTMAGQGVPYLACLRVRAAGRYPSSAIAKGIRVVVRTVLLSSATLPTIAASVIHVPSQLPPIERATSEKKPVCQFCHSPADASPASVGRKYAAIDSGTTRANALG